MNFIRWGVCAVLLLLSGLTSASIVTTNDGFVDTSSNLEWLLPSKIASFEDYSTYAGNGWHVATSNELATILTNSYSLFDAALFDSFATLAMPQDATCTQASVVFCSYGWYANVSTADGHSFGYEYGWIGLLARIAVSPSLVITDPAYVNSWRDDPALVSAWGLETGSFSLTSTIGSYSLYGYGNSYSTFMVRAVPLPATVYLLMSACAALGVRRTRRLA